MENRVWLRPRAEPSSRSGAPAPARGPLAAATAGRQEREDESLLPATRSIVSSSSSGDGARLNLISARVRAGTHGGRQTEKRRETGENERRGKILGAVGYAAPISAAQETRTLICTW
jgi:hypothetical protein